MHENDVSFESSRLSGSIRSNRKDARTRRCKALFSEQTAVKNGGIGNQGVIAL